MTISLSNPDGLHPTPGYHHVTRVQADTMVYLAGQCPLTSAGELAEGGLSGQTAQVIDNILTALAAAGAGPEDVVRTVIYVKSTDRDELGMVWDQLNESPLAAGVQVREHAARCRPARVHRSARRDRRHCGAVRSWLGANRRSGS